MRERTQTGQASILTDLGVAHANPYPILLRLIRSDNTFYAYKSSDGLGWTLLRTTTNDMPSNAPFGLVTLGSVSTPNKAYFDNVIAVGASY